MATDMFPSPDECMREGRADALTVLGLAALRNLSFTLLMAGATVAILMRRVDDNFASQFDTPSEIWNALSTPLAGIALAVAVRIVVGVLSFLSAVRLVPMADNPRIIRRLSDQTRRIGALMSLRGTWKVREAAVLPAGPWGRRLHVAATAFMVLAVIGFIAMLLSAIIVNL